MAISAYYPTQMRMRVIAAMVSIGCANGSNAELTMTNPTWQFERNQMVDQQIIGRGVEDLAVITAMRRVPRHRFVSEGDSNQAYEDHPLPIGYGQTISQPYIVAFMTEALQLKPNDRVLEIGTGSGYQAAVLAEIVAEVFTIEVVEALAQRAEATLQQLDYRNIMLRTGDGYQGWPEHAPFDAVILTAAPDHVPQPLLDQLAVGGRLIIPVGKQLQELVLIHRTQPDEYTRTVLLPVAFVPMTGEAEKK